MQDPLIKKLAEILVHYSVQVKKDDHVMIKLVDEGMPLMKEVYGLCLRQGAIVRTSILDTEMESTYYRHASLDQIGYFFPMDMQEVRWLDCSIGIFGERNSKYLADADPAKMAARMKTVQPIRNHLVNNVRWVICNYPSQGLAQDAEMNLDDYADFVFAATNLDWKKVSEKQDRLRKILDKGKEVRLLGSDTDLRFRIAGRKAIRCDGHRNMPDGEVFLAPDEFSAEGRITFDFPAIFHGKEVEGIELCFEKGLCSSAKARKNENFLNTILDTDSGSRRIGEFGIGTNYGIGKFTKNILFDEKIGGSIHLAMGRAYEEGGGKNKSAIHWDMVKDLRTGGEIQIDGQCILRNGKALY